MRERGRDTIDDSNNPTVRSSADGVPPHHNLTKQIDRDPHPRIWILENPNHVLKPNKLQSTFQAFICSLKCAGHLKLDRKITRNSELHWLMNKINSPDRLVSNEMLKSDMSSFPNPNTNYDLFS